ncbi:MAG: Stp1/IreP family PP2C-type Ser/Thr phosphatase [Candidatus Binatia bacterium]
MNIQSAFLSDVGRVRRQNEDSVAVLPDERLFVVADGMGGHAGGKRASETAVETVVSHVRQTLHTRTAGNLAPPRINREQLVEGILRANHRILELARMDSSLHGMGTTVAALLIEGEREGAVVHVGDSRVYRLRGDRFEQLTADHSLVADLVRRGEISDEEARHHPYRHTLTRALGAGADVQPEVLHVDPAVGDLYILCSDGVYGMLDDEQLNALAVANRDDPAALCRRLIDEANAAGGKDNASAIVVLCGD